MVYRSTRGGTTSRPRRLALGVRTRPLDQEVALGLAVPGARPGDVVEFYGQVSDNDGRGAKTARTPLFTLTYPSVSDRFDDLDARRDSTVETLGQMREQARESSERFQRLRQDLRQSLDPDWEDRRQVEELRREQQKLRDQARDLQRQMDRLQQQMQDSEMMDEQTRQSFEQMQRVMEELDSPELRDALQRLQEAMEKLDVRDMLQQAEDAAQSEEEFRRRLERAVELMERLEAAVEMEEIARRAEDLAETEERLAKETEAARERGGPKPERDRLAGEQRQAAEQAEDLREQVEGLQEQTEDMSNAPKEGLQETKEQLDSETGLPQQMEQNAQQLEKNRTQEAQDGQQEMAEQLRQMARRMRQQSQQMQGKQSRVDQAALRRALEDVLTISRDQEALATTTARTPSQNPALVGAARRQSELRDGLRTVVDTLRRVARTVPQLGPEIDKRAANGRREMDQAVERLAERQSGPAAGHQRSAMSHLNELALLLADVLDQLKDQAQNQGQGQGGGGTSQQMQQIGQQQQRLNQRIQQMLNESAGERLSPDGERRMRQMAEQQERLRRQLEQARQGMGSGGNPNDRSAMQRIEERMKEAAQELRRGRPSERTAPRQQQILEQLLETERSVNERGREEKREGQSGQTRPPPPAAPPRSVRPADRVRGDLIRALESGYAPDYQDLIKRVLRAATGPDGRLGSVTVVTTRSPESRIATLGERSAGSRPVAALPPPSFPRARDPVGKAQPTQSIEPRTRFAPRVVSWCGLNRSAGPVRLRWSPWTGASRWRAWPASGSGDDLDVAVAHDLAVLRHQRQPVQPAGVRRVDVAGADREHDRPALGRLGPGRPRPSDGDEPLVRVPGPALEHPEVQPPRHPVAVDVDRQRAVDRERVGERQPEVAHGHGVGRPDPPVARVLAERLPRGVGPRDPLDGAEERPLLEQALGVGVGRVASSGEHGHGEDGEQAGHGGGRGT